MNTIVEYLNHRLLAKAQVKPQEVRANPVPNIALRLTLLDQGKIAAAILPEPLLSEAIVKGSRLLVDDIGDSYSHAVLVFRQQAITEKPEAVRKLLTGLGNMIDRINTTPEAYRTPMAERCRVPASVRDSFMLYKYEPRSLPSQELFADVQEWLVNEKKLPAKIPYADLIDGQFYASQSSRATSTKS